MFYQGEQRDDARGRIPDLRPLHPEDALFLYAETANVTQLVGGVVLLAGHVGSAQVRDRVHDRLSGTPNLRRRLVAPPSPWRGPSWLVDDEVDLREHVKERILGGPGECATFSELIDDFYSTPLDLRRPLWEIHVVQGVDTDRTGLVVKLHHALADGFTAIANMTDLLDGHEPAEQPPAPARRARGAAPGLTTRVHSGRQALRGLVDLARAGPAPFGVLTSPSSSTKRHCATMMLPVREVLPAARAMRARTSDFLLALVVDGIDRLLARRGEATDGMSLRVMVPRTLRTSQAGRVAGNATAAISLDLSLGSMPPRARLEELRAGSEHRRGKGQPEATHLALRAMGLLPAPLHAWAARHAYNAHWFNLIASVIPGPYKPQYLWDVRLAEVYPILPIAEGTGLAIGMMRWSDSFAIGLTADAALVPDVDQLAETIRESFTDYQRAAHPPAG